jgi:formiminoglutamase
MNLNDYFDPVSLNKPDEHIRFDNSMFGRNIYIHTPSTPIDEISNYHLAIMGVKEDRNSFNTGSSEAPDRIRQKLYELYRINEKLHIIDLGNLKRTGSPEDTYFGVRDVMTDLLNNQVIAIVIGGSQDITKGIFMAFEHRDTLINAATIDSRLDMDEGPLNSSSWNLSVIGSRRLFRYTHLGHQQYLVNPEHIRYIEQKGFDLIRLGLLRSNMMMAEPYLRDSNLVSFDIAAIKQPDAPGTRFSSPNGLLAEEACQLTRFAGLSDQVCCFGIFETNPGFDSNDQTAHLAAQAIWYFIEGFSMRKKERPAQNQKDFKEFVVNHSDMEHSLTFYKSLVTGRWWMEVPEMESGNKILVACSQEDYQQACNHEIPEMWWKAFQRIN